MNSFYRGMLFLSVWAIAQYAMAADTEEDEVTVPSGVRFTHHSSLAGKDTDGRYNVERFIRNDSDGFLCVDWPAGDIHCTGDHQLLPHGKAYCSPGQKTRWSVPDDSIICYGLKLQYKAENVKVHVTWHDPARADNKGSLTSEFEIDDSNGSPVYQVEVDSEVNQEQNVCGITFKVNRKLNIILPGQFAQLKLLKSTNELWKISNNIQLSEILKGNKNVIVSDKHWLQMNTGGEVKPIEIANPFFSESKSGSTFFVAGAPNGRWVPTRVPILAFERGKTGSVGMVADIYLQEQ